MKKQSSVAIVGASKLFREGLQELLRRSKFTVLTSFDGLDDCGSAELSSQVDLAIIVISNTKHPGEQIEQIGSFSGVRGKIRIVLIADTLGTQHLRDAVAAGVHAVVSKDITGEVLHRVLELVMLGQQLFPGQPDNPPPRGNETSLVPFIRPTPSPAPAAASAAQGVGNATTRDVIRSIFPDIIPGRSMSLSERERQILHCLMDGASNKTIARHLAITEATVKVHIKGLLRKIQVTNRTQAAVWGLNNTGMLDESVVTAKEETMSERLAV